MWFDQKRKKRFVMYIMGVAIMAALLTAISLMSVAWINFVTLREIAASQWPHIYDGLIGAVWRLGVLFVVFFAVLTIVAALCAIVLSRAILGAIHAIKSDLEHLAAGDYARAFLNGRGGALRSLKKVFEILRIFLKDAVHSSAGMDAETLRLIERVSDSELKNKLKDVARHG